MWQLAALLGIGLGILNHKDKFGSEAPEFPIQPFDARYSEKESSDDWAMRQKGYQSMRFQNNYDAEQVPSRKVRSISGKSVKLRPLQKDRNLKPKEARDRLEISAEEEGYTFLYYIYVDGEVEDIGQLTVYGKDRMKAYQDAYVVIGEGALPDEEIEVIYEPTPFPYAPRIDAETFEAEYPKYREYKGAFITRTAKNRAKLASDMWDMTATLYKPRKKGNWILQLTQSHPRLGDRYKTEVKNFTDGLNLYLKLSDLSPLDAETFNATIMRGKPKGYVGKAVATDRMLKESDIEHMMLQLETAVKLGLISEDEIMRQLQEKFGSEEYAGNYMVPADIKSIARSISTLQKKAKADQNTPEWWKSKLSVVAAELDDLTDFFDYAEDAGML